MKRILLFLVGIILIIPTSVKANYLVSYHNYGVTSAEERLIEEEASEERNVFEELYYRIVIKDTRDVVDYVILGTIIFLMLATIIVSNKRTYVIPGSAGVFLDNETDNVDIRKIDSEPDENSQIVKEDVTDQQEEETAKKDK